jgi:hypothetical protein
MNDEGHYFYDERNQAWGYFYSAPTEAEGGFLEADDE